MGSAYFPLPWDRPGGSPSQRGAFPGHDEGPDRPVGLFDGGPNRWEALDGLSTLREEAHGPGRPVE